MFLKSILIRKLRLEDCEFIIDYVYILVYILKHVYV